MPSMGRVLILTYLQFNRVMDGIFKSSEIVSMCGTSGMVRSLVRSEIFFSSYFQILCEVGGLSLEGR